MAKKTAQTTKPVSSQVKYFDKKLLMISGVLFAGLILAISVFAVPKQQLPQQQYLKRAPVVTAAVAKDSFTYAGQEGVDALALLKKQASVTLAASGLVTDINGRTADNAKHEYWEFFINGKSSDVGPKSYVTKKGDVLTWKIATY